MERVLSQLIVDFWCAGGEKKPNVEKKGGAKHVTKGGERGGDEMSVAAAVWTALAACRSHQMRPRKMGQLLGGLSIPNAVLRLDFYI
jgi:metal-dependent amidase/aminoacylase/carboxypeptidase family protein